MTSTAPCRPRKTTLPPLNPAMTRVIPAATRSPTSTPRRRRRAGVMAPWPRIGPIAPPTGPTGPTRGCRPGRSGSAARRCPKTELTVVRSSLKPAAILELPPPSLRARRMGGMSTAAQRIARTRITTIATLRASSGPVPNKTRRIPVDSAVVRTRLVRPGCQTSTLGGEKPQMARSPWSVGRCQRPERPPVFSHSARSPIVIARSTDLHMS